MSIEYGFRCAYCAQDVYPVAGHRAICRCRRLHVSAGGNVYGAHVKVRRIKPSAG